MHFSGCCLPFFGLLLVGLCFFSVVCWLCFVRVTCCVRPHRTWWWISPLNRMSSPFSRPHALVLLSTTASLSLLSTTACPHSLDRMTSRSLVSITCPHPLLDRIPPHARLRVLTRSNAYPHTLNRMTTPSSGPHDLTLLMNARHHTLNHMPSPPFDRM